MLIPRRSCGRRALVLPAELGVCELYQIGVFTEYGRRAGMSRGLSCRLRLSMIRVSVRPNGFTLVLPVAQKGMRVNQEQFEALVQRLEQQAERSPGVYRAKLGAMALLGYGYIAGVLTLLLVAVALLALLAVQ